MAAERVKERERMNDGYLSLLNEEDRHGVETRGTKTDREWYRRMRYLPERTIGSQSRAESEYCVYPYARLCDANNLVLLHLLRVPARFFRDWHSFQPFFPSTPSLGLEYLFARYTRVIYAYPPLYRGVGVSCYCCFFLESRLFTAKRFSESVSMKEVGYCPLCFSRDAGSFRTRLFG